MTYLTALLDSGLRNTQIRRLQLRSKAVECNAEFNSNLANHQVEIDGAPTTNRNIDFVFENMSRKPSEMSVKKGLKTANNSSLVYSINAKIEKVSTTYKVIRPINPNDIEDDS